MQDHPRERTYASRRHQLADVSSHEARFGIEQIGRGLAEMDTASCGFVAFGLIVALISNLNRSRVWRSSVLMLASLIFLGMLTHQPLALVPLITFLFFAYFALFLIQRGRSQVFTWSLICIVVAYIWLKKYTFLPHQTLFSFPYLALGLSYVFFRVLHLLIESRENHDGQRVGLGEYILYMLNFTTFISGPIQRYDEFARDQFTGDPISLDVATIGAQCERIIRGFFKVNVVAMLLQAFWEDARLELLHALPVQARAFAGMRIAVLYSLFLYANFSGYIDIVIALARLMRLRVPENFDRPLFATSFLDFWNRWHITLSTWFKTYVYNPLLLSMTRKNTSRTLEPFLGVFCFFVTFFLVGVWHGRTSEFIFYGLLQGSGVAVNKLWQIQMTRVLGRKNYRILTANSLYLSLSRGLTFCWFAFTLTWFWGSWRQIYQVEKALGSLMWGVIWIVIWFGASLILHAWEAVRVRLVSLPTVNGLLLQNRYMRIVYATALGFIAVLVTTLANSPAPGIVYKAF